MTDPPLTSTTSCCALSLQWPAVASSSRWWHAPGPHAARIAHRYKTSDQRVNVTGPPAYGSISRNIAGAATCPGKNAAHRRCHPRTDDAAPPISTPTPPRRRCAGGRYRSCPCPWATSRPPVGVAKAIARRFSSVGSAGGASSANDCGRFDVRKTSPSSGWCRSLRFLTGFATRKR